jgi:predicted dehydrogenase
MSLWLIGTGPHAVEYSKVLTHLNLDYEVIGRGSESAEAFFKLTGKKPNIGGIKNALNLLTPPTDAIVAVSFEELSHVAIDLIKAGTKRILLEKPGGLNKQQIQLIHDGAEKYKSSVWIAYNRRFYSSTLQALQGIADDGGAISCNFEFTEWAHKIKPWKAPSEVKQFLMIANSSHVADLAFFICGKPKEWKGWYIGATSWHPASARFCGAGITENKILFSYNADWEGPGRWGLEVITRKNRFIFKPLEQLYVTKIGSVAVDQIVLNDQLDKIFKPGLYLQTKAFIDNNCENLCSLSEQVNMISIYSKMAGY